MSEGHGHGPKGRSLDEIAEDLSAVEGQIKDNAGKFIIRELSHEKNSVKSALKTLDYVNEGGPEGVKDKIESLDQEVKSIVQGLITKTIEDVRKDKGLDTYHFYTENHQERLDFSKSLIGKVIAQALEAHTKLYGTHDEYEHMIHKLQEDGFNTQLAQDALNVLFSHLNSRTKENVTAPNFEQLIQEMAEHLEDEGSFYDLESTIGKKLYQPLILAATSAASDLKAKPLQYLSIHGDDVDGRKEVAEYITGKIAGDAYKGKVAIKPHHMSDMAKLIPMINDGSDKGYRSKDFKKAHANKKLEFDGVKKGDIYR